MSLCRTKSTHEADVCSSSWSPESRSAKTTPVIAMYRTAAERAASKRGVRCPRRTSTSRNRAATARRAAAAISVSWLFSGRRFATVMMRVIASPRRDSTYAAASRPFAMTETRDRAIPSPSRKSAAAGELATRPVAQP